MNYSASLGCIRVWRKFTVLAIGVALVAGCNGAGTEGKSASGSVDPPQNGGGGNQSSAGNLLKSNLARDTSPAASDADLAAVVAANTAFAIKSFASLAADPDSNAIFSPYSITMASALLAPGALGTTLSGIEQALSFSLPQDRLNPALNRLDQILAGETTGAALDTNGLAEPIFTNANAVWSQQGFSILQTYLDTLAINYGAGVHLTDFNGATEVSRQTINDWVAAQTNQRILNLLPQGSVTRDTLLVLTNAVWFKASWASQFSPGATLNRSFSNHNGSSSSVPFMSQQLSALYAQADGCQAIELPYAGNKLSMLVIMPDPGSFDSFATSLTPDVLSGLIGNMAAKEVAFSLPKFTFSSSFDLGAMLRSFGMNDAFDPARADFSGIDGARDLSVASALHQAFIGVDENGTEAAAATAYGMVGTAVRLPDLTLAIDHPFMYLIRERQTGSILFMGKVVAL